MQKMRVCERSEALISGLPKDSPGIAAFQLAHNQSPIRTTIYRAPLGASYPSLRQRWRPVRRAHPIAGTGFKIRKNAH